MQIETDVAWQLGPFEQTDLRGIVTRSHFAADQLGEIEENDDVNTSPRCISTQYLPDLDVQTCFLPNLATSRFFRTLSCLDKSARQTPVIHEWLAIATHQDKSTFNGNKGRSNRLRIVPMYEIAS